MIIMIMIIISRLMPYLGQSLVGNSFSRWISLVYTNTLHCSRSLIVAIAVSHFNVF